MSKSVWCVHVWAPTCAASWGLGNMALTGLSRGDKHAFSLACLCFSAIWGEPGRYGMLKLRTHTHTQTHNSMLEHIKVQTGARCFAITHKYWQSGKAYRSSPSPPKSLSTIFSASLATQDDKWPGPLPPQPHSLPSSLLQWTITVRTWAPARRARICSTGEHKSPHNHANAPLSQHAPSAAAPLLSSSINK